MHSKSIWLVASVDPLSMQILNQNVCKVYLNIINHKDADIRNKDKIKWKRKDCKNMTGNHNKQSNWGKFCTKKK